MRNTNKFILIALMIFCHVSAFARVVKKKATTQASAVVDAVELEKDLIRYPGSSSVLVQAKQAVLIDYHTGKVLLEKRADERITPSSMTKMMTSYIIEEKLQKKELTMESSFPVDEESWRLQGSKTYVQLGSMMKLSDILRGIIIQSGNDASSVAAKGIAGNETQFAALMNAKAKALGLNSTNFKNSHGLPEKDHHSTARDLTKLGVHIIKDHPEFYNIYQEKDFTFNNIKQGNRNPLLYGNNSSEKTGCDGIKTGHTDDGGYGAVLSCVDGSQRYVLTINGLNTMQARADESRRLMAWARENFEGRLALKKGDVIEPSVKVKFGLKPTIRLAVRDDIHTLALRSDNNPLSKRVEIRENIIAPIKEGDVLGKIFVQVNGNEQQADLVSLDDSEKMGLIKQALSYVGL